jgi:hypothetical protein
MCAFSRTDSPRDVYQLGRVSHCIFTNAGTVVCRRIGWSAGKTVEDFVGRESSKTLLSLHKLKHSAKKTIESVDKYRPSDQRSADEVEKVQAVSD